MGCVYLARCKINGKGYVGWTVDFEQRKKFHNEHAEAGMPWLFQKAIRKYGWDAFEWSILTEDDDKDWLCLMEQKWIKRLGTKMPNGYNMTDGGEGFRGNHTEETKAKISATMTGKQVSEETRKRLSESLKGKPSPRKGQHLSESHRKNLVGSRIGYRHSEETKEKMRKSRIGRKLSDEHKKNIGLGLLGRPVSEETRQKIRLSNLGKIVSDESRQKMSEAKKRLREKDESNHDDD